MNQENIDKRETELSLALSVVNGIKLKHEFQEEMAILGIKKEEQVIKPIAPIRKWWYAVTAIFFFGLAIVYFMKNNFNALELGQQYALESSMKHPGLTKGNTNEINLSAAIEAFNNNDWKNAIESLEKTDLTVAENTFYLGLSYFNDKQYQKSISFFTKQNLENSNFIQERNWYMGLAYLLSNDNKNAKATLSKLKPNEWQYEKASKLLVK